MQAVKRIFTLLIVCLYISFGSSQTNNCGVQKFQCRNGECIVGELLCDGTAHCKDSSDETEAECTKTLCPVHAFRCNYGACINEDSVCNGIQDCVDNSDETHSQCRKRDTSSQASQQTQNFFPVIILNKNTRITVPVPSCRMPPQPQNGHWTLRCAKQGCYSPQTRVVIIGSRIIYFCQPGYIIKGPSDAYCKDLGTWSELPVCIEIRCTPLTTASSDARCTYNDEWASCESPVLPETMASLTCRNGYQREPSLSSKDEVKCSPQGQWEPQPIKCIPVCGRLPGKIAPLGVTSNITEFPWHASLYRDWTGEGKRYYCGASIIKENLLITSAKCVYDENAREVIDAKEIYILTGNVYRDYDSPLHDRRLVRKNQVKNIYIMCNYLGFVGNFSNDIAILELVKPFVLSYWLVPVCIDFSSDLMVLEAGIYGKVPGFNRTVTGEYTGILQALAVSYIPYDQCRSAARTANVEQYITSDKLCADYTNDSSVCVGDSGSGLIFKTDGVWYLRGIVSVSLDMLIKDRLIHCDNSLYSLYTRVHSHIGWIQDIIARLERNQSYLSCRDSNMSPLHIREYNIEKAPTQSTPLQIKMFCRAPPQPENGHWKLPWSECSSKQDCDVPEGTQLEMGSYLIYSCNAGYKMIGSTYVSCNFEGKWLNIPVCIVRSEDEQTNNACELERFQCHSGECIEKVLLCDGEANCLDSSDETATECAEISCPLYTFRCNYGACINRDSVCNGIQDCVDNSDETECSAAITNTQTERPTLCKAHQYMCNNGQCISNINVCDGFRHCADDSDETFENCASLLCPPTAFQCNYGACIDGDLWCNGVADCADGSDESQTSCSGLFRRPTSQPTQPPPPTLPNLSPVTPSTRYCTAPPQPQNGYWKLHRSQCLSGQDCDIAEGTELELGSFLIYSCNTGFKLKGSADVVCGFEGKLLNIPICIFVTEIRCAPLTTASTEARCVYNDEWVSCESPVLPKTRASLTCRNSYQRKSSLLSKNQVRCNTNGQWEPEPMKCIPVYGKLPADVTPLIVNGLIPNVTEFPWHASMYYGEPGKSKKYFCGATIIQENLLITAAHCVYDEMTKQVIDRKIYIVTGNIFRDYDSPFHDSHLVKKNQVKRIYIPCDYKGLTGNYVFDIAILELVEPFVLSSWLVPVGIDPFNDSTVLEVGTHGKVPWFNGTANGESSAILQALTVPYIPYNQCRNAGQNADEVEYSIVDKFCAGYLNGSSVCVGDSGSGLIFKTDGVWYLRGIVSVPSGVKIKDRIAHCNNNLYSLYTRIHSHIGWIQDVIAGLERNQIYPSCPNNIIEGTKAEGSFDSTQSTIPTSSPVISSIRTCKVPLQPQNGYWKLHQSHCPNKQECDLAEETEIEIGSHVVYFCNPGYKMIGCKDVYCTHKGKWSDIPVCIEIRCASLTTASTKARCIYNNEWVSCESPVLPRTRASLTCRNNYQREPSLLPRDKVICNAQGQWEPQPIQCIPECGRLPVEVTPLDVASNITEFPWHASLYRDWAGEKKRYYCGASIIKKNLLITSAKCVYDENTKEVIDAKEIHILTGNVYPDYDSPLHDRRYVRKNQVKNIYIICNYLGQKGNYLYNIAILELVKPFVVSSSLVPVCIDLFGDETVLETVVYGKVPGFRGIASNEFNAALQTALTVQYIPITQCKSAAQNVHMEEYITNDKFCADASVCDCDSGNGLVFQTNGLWYLRGIVSVSLDMLIKDRTAHYDNNLFSLHTRISSYVGWILDVSTRLEQNQSYPLCQDIFKSPLLPKKVESILLRVQSKSVLYPPPTSSTTEQSTRTNSKIQIQSTSTFVTSSICRAPPQPENGHWKLPWSECPSEQDCDIPERTQLKIGSYLIYSCNEGYKMIGSTYVSCNFEGKWLNIPVCIEIRCKALSTVSTQAKCAYNNKWVSCESSVLPGTKASLSCRNSYQRDLSLFARNQVVCNAIGQWEPEPMRCVPVCGKLPADVTPLIIDGVTPNITEFPWHASMYSDEPGKSKKYFCGASIIKENLLITAAHCVYDEITGRVTDKKIYVITGNIFRDYDSPMHDPRLVERNQVKNIYPMCDYIGLTGNYVFDIAILELVKPFKLSTWLVPVCIDSSSYLSVLEVGAFGKVAGFGKATSEGKYSGVLQALTVPYIPYYQCRNVSKNVRREEYSIVDKFCAGYSNGSSVCDGDSGGGLVFETNGLWYLQGIVSVSLSTIQIGGTIHCDNKFYSLYTRVSYHISWIQNVIFNLKHNQTYPSCQDVI